LYEPKGSSGKGGRRIDMFPVYNFVVYQLGKANIQFVDAQVLQSWTSAIAHMRGAIIPARQILADDTQRRGKTCPKAEFS
jgi:hypothetical protein